MNNSFFAMLYRMRYIERWALMRATEKENLSEHSLDVAILTEALINIANIRFDAKLDANLGSNLALYHDVPEIITGDLPTPIKYHDEIMKNAYKKIEKQAIDRLLDKLPEDFKNIYKEKFEENADYEPYIKAADKLAALIKCIEERKAGNNEFKLAESQARNHISLELPAAKVFITEFLPAFELTLDEL